MTHQPTPKPPTLDSDYDYEVSEEIEFHNDEELLNYLNDKEIEELFLEIDWSTWTITNHRLCYPIRLAYGDIILSVNMAKNPYDQYDSYEDYLNERYF